jgi:peptide/nickel transport system permease protein
MAVMRTYILRRLLVAIPSLLIASLIVFTLPRLIPGDVVQLMLEEKAYGKDLDDLRAKLGLDRPVHVQYFQWLGEVARGNFGESLWTRQPVLHELARRLPVTATLGVLAIAVAVIIGIPVGVIAAVRQDGVLDFFARSAAILGLSIPGFVKAILVILLPAIWWGWTPLVRFVGFAADPVAYVGQFILPAIILGIASAAGIMRLTRGMLLEVLRQD